VYQPFLVRSMRDLRVSCPVLHRFFTVSEEAKNTVLIKFRVKGFIQTKRFIVYFRFQKENPFHLTSTYFSFRSISFLLFFSFLFFLRRAVLLLRFRIECDGNKCRMRVAFTNRVFSIISASRNITT